ncbi:serine/threonine protein phosphatase [Dehalobacter sp. DCM]|uniref:metallophosphoesterase n=1 Tax=Dehalobacter sp. DCM TaxID=2907827 RepID=UPI0030814EF7|nr:serine/threonine protein phosphatase [Dehalobacter sp. DCM]
MDTLKCISNVFRSADVIPIDDNSKLILMSDVHRGDGSWADDLYRNENVYYAALTHYFNEGYTYIELGDGDELWKNKKMAEIVPVHLKTFKLLTQFYHSGRLYFIYGNHDMVKSHPNFVQKNMVQYVDEHSQKITPLFENIKIHEGLVLNHTRLEQKIFLIHGHQASNLDYDFWALRRWLVRYVWKHLESLGFNDPTSTAINYRKKVSIEEKLTEWTILEKQMLIAGHTHRPMFPQVGEPPYFNDGSCVHPYSITGIEIADSKLTLVKWEINTRTDGTLFIDREVLAGPQRLKDYFDSLYKSQLND